MTHDFTPPCDDADQPDAATVLQRELEEQITLVSTSSQTWTDLSTEIMSEDPKDEARGKPNSHGLDSQETLLASSVESKTKQESWIDLLWNKAGNNGPHAISDTWKPSFVRTGPLLGLIALSFIVLSIPASAIVLAVSHGQAVENWIVQPSVYISVLIGIGNKALGFAAVQGAIITWWVRALKGTTLQQLHYDWPAGNAGITSLRRKHVSRLSVTSVCAFVILADGILLQSATGTVEARLDKPVSLRARVSPEIPTNYTATGSLLGVNNTYLNAEISSQIKPVWDDWINGRAIPSPLSGCQGVCTATITAAAVAQVECHDEPNQTMNYTAIRTSNRTSLPFSCQRQGTQNRCALFEIHVQPSSKSGVFETIDVSFGRFVVSSSEMAQDCAGDYTYKTCSFRSAVAEYNVTTYNDTYVVLNSPLPNVIGLANNTARETYSLNQVIGATIGGVGLLASMDVYTYITMWSPGEKYQYTDNVDTFQAKLMDNAFRFYAGDDCAPSWNNPMSDITATLNDVMFRTAVHAASELPEAELLDLIDPGLEVDQEVQGLRVDAQPIFKTRWPFFWAAASVQLVCVLLVLVTYWDYWKLGRSVSLSPLEIAKAFDAPLLRDLPSNTEPSVLAKAIGNEETKYGAVQGAVNSGILESPSYRLVFASPNLIKPPGGRILA
ncbi:Hypothetical predicted protein [Lecanosticta acicola]|uniref:Transmembrane protein n=1 Tax=Lecanosticta acicola TaxID=111012 RepID=A0AAI8Z810_9PEZI|nr:Hypothetical predicted protein [Lecanosticta acicola]